MSYPPIPGAGDHDQAAPPPPQYPPPPPQYLPPPPPQHLPPPPPPFATPYGPARTNDKATWSMVLGIVGLVGFFCFAGVLSIGAIVLGHIAKQEIDGSAGTLKGRGQAEAGFIMGIIGAVILVIWTALVIIGSTVGPPR